MDRIEIGEAFMERAYGEIRQETERQLDKKGHWL